jgi:fructose-1,6-bisphosphatase/sedoheptulose 1,7-bisphosphatase-like protein
MDSDLSLEFFRVIEQAAIACARTMGLGDWRTSDHAAVETMRMCMDTVPIDGTIVIGEGDEAPMLFIGEKSDWRLAGRPPETCRRSTSPSIRWKARTCAPPGKRLIFAATGVTDGTLMKGVRFFGDGVRTSSLIMQSEPARIRFIDTIQRRADADGRSEILT